MPRPASTRQMKAMAMLMTGEEADADQRDHHAVTEGEEKPAPARAARACEAVDGDEVVRIQAMLQAEDEEQRGQAEDVGHFWMNKRSPSFIPLSCSSSTVAESTR